MNRLVSKYSNYCQKILLLFFVLAIFNCKNKPIYPLYPIELTLHPDTSGVFGPYLPQYEPGLVLSVKNVGPKNVIMYEYRYENANFGYVPANNKTEYFRGTLDRPVSAFDAKIITEYWGMFPKADTIQPDQEKTCLYELQYFDISNKGINFILIEVPLESSYFDSLNMSLPFALNQLYPKIYNKGYSHALADKKLRHPFFVFSIQDSFYFKDVTKEFIDNKVINQVK